MKHKPYYKAVRAVISRYPRYCAELEEMRSRKGDDIPTRSPGKISRPTERLALIQLTDPVARAEYDAVHKAITHTERLPTGAERLQVIRLKYWTRRRHDLREAARVIHYSQQQTWRYHIEFEQLVARFLYGDS